jgi:hypothetical protein
MGAAMMAAAMAGGAGSLRKTVAPKAMAPLPDGGSGTAAPFLRKQETKEALERNRNKLLYASRLVITLAVRVSWC